MSIHTVISVAVLAAVCAGLLYAFAPGEVAALRRWWTRPAREDAALLARATAQPADPEPVQAWRGAPWVTGTGEIPVVGAQPVCHCGGRHCRAQREGRDCATDGLTQRAAYWRPVTAGWHDVHQVRARWLAGDWWDSPLPADLRLRLARMAGAVRAPVQLAGPVGRLP